MNNSNNHLFPNEKEYWQYKLAGELKRSSFPYSPFSTEREAGEKRGEYSFVLREETALRILALAGENSIKVNMILTAGLLLLLCKSSEQKDLVIVAPILRQEKAGNFVNTVLLLRNAVHIEKTGKEFLLQVRECIVEASKYQNYAIESILADLKLPNSPAVFPLCDVAILLKNIHSRDYLSIPLNLVFIFEHGEKEVKCTLEFNAGLYSPAMIENLGFHFDHIMQQFLSGMDAPLSSLTLLTENEKEKVLFHFNNQSLAVDERSLETLFESVCRKQPDGIALVSYERHFSFWELNKEANRLAWCLRDKGILPGTIVGILMEAGFELAAAIWAVLKSGGAYLPLDSHYPISRLGQMIRDSQTSLIISQEGFQKKLTGYAEIVLFGQHNTPEKAIIDFPACGQASDPLYVVFTSGSTGVPKGVVVEDRQIENYIFWRMETYKQNSRDCCLQLVPFSFDGFAANFYPSLLSGAKLVMENEGYFKDSEFMRNILAKEQVTHFSTVPAMLRILIFDAKKEEFNSIRFVVVAGEEADHALLRSMNILMGGVTIINEYGPSECSVTAAAYLNLKKGETSLIGQVIANNAIYILDDRGEPRPLEIVGEAFIAGKSVSRGYLNRPELTAEKYPADPFVTERLMYKTGDLIRRLPEGTLQFIGRKDNQVKLHGFRIELEEIERQLKNHSQVRNAVVISRQDERGDSYLCAYLLLRQEDVALSDIRNFLGMILPEYMIPSYFIKLDEMPVNSSGKIDRGKLLDIRVQLADENEYVPPGNDLERELAAIWQGELELQRVGIKDNYFNIGGDSIKSISLLNTINEKFKCQLKVVDLYENETIEKLAVKIKSSLELNSHEDFKEVANEIAALKKSLLEVK